MKESYLYEPTNSRLITAGNRTMKQSDKVKRQQYYSKPYQKAKTEINSDSLQMFQQQLDSLVIRKKSEFRRNKPKKKQVTAQHIPSKQTIELKEQMTQIRNILNSDRQNQQHSKYQQKLDKLLVELQDQKSRKTETLLNPPFNSPKSIAQNTTSNYPVQIIPQSSSPYMFPQQMPQQQSPYPFYYPFPMPYPQNSSCHPHRRHRRRRYDSSQSSSSSQSPQKRQKTSLPQVKKKKQPKIYEPRRDKLVKKLRKIFYVVAFTTFIKSQTKKLSSHRKSNLKKFWLQKFNPQINNIKNWLLDSHKYSLSIILEKSSLIFRLNVDIKDNKRSSIDNKFTNTMDVLKTHKSLRSTRLLNSQKIKKQKQKLVMQVIHIGLGKLLEDSVPQKISMFAELIVYLCRKNSFAMGRFWSAYEMQQLCVSEYYGFLRLDENLEKYLIGLLIFIKVLVYNMFLQPHKFDADNFTKDKQPLKDNMLFISSIIYQMAKEVIEKYRLSHRDETIYKSGNWLKISKQFIVQCSEPFIYGRVLPEEDEYISGLVPLNQFQQLKQHQYWKLGCQKIELIIEKVHKQMFNKAKLMRKNLKYKLYN